MKTLIYFNKPDCPENMGISQLTHDLDEFLRERSDIIINPSVDGNILNFIKPDKNSGYAILAEVPENFEN